MKPSTSKPVKRTQKYYNLGSKLAIIFQVEKGEMTYTQAQRAYGIQRRSTGLVWLKKLGTSDSSQAKPVAMVYF